MTKEKGEAFIVENLVRVKMEIGLDPATLPEHRVRFIRAVHLFAQCESLFHVIAQLGWIERQDNWIRRHERHADALIHLGELGQALAAAASEETEHLEMMLDRKDREGGNQ